MLGRQHCWMASATSTARTRCPPLATAASRRRRLAGGAATGAPCAGDLQLEVRKLQIVVEETHIEQGVPLATPAVKVAVAAAVRNPLAGRFVEDLEPMFSLGSELGRLLAQRGVEALQSAARAHHGFQAELPVVDAYGKGCIVGLRGELEHSAAILHPMFGKPVREAVGGGPAIIPGTKKMGGAGSSITIPITSKDDVFSFPHMDSIDISMPDAPR